MTDAKISVDVSALLDHERRQHENDIQRLSGKIRELNATLGYEKERRIAAEKRVSELEQKLLGAAENKRKRRTKAEIEASRADDVEYSEYKSNGVRKPHKTEPIRSYTDFKKIQDYFLERKQIRNYMMWTIGVCLGVRASDLCRLRWRHLLNEDYTYRDRVKITEKKTGKLQGCLITEAIREAVTKYLNSVSWDICLDEFVFAKTTGAEAPITEKHCWRILKTAAEAVGIDYNIGSHSMRRSFANIALCVDESTIDMNAITKIQGLLNHSDPRVTLRYLGTLDKMYDNARVAVSNFVLGKTDVDELIAGDNYNLSSIMDKLMEIEEKLS